MNERIKELALQAGIEFVYDPTETPMRAFVECWEDDLEKFAELIVQECNYLIQQQVSLKYKDGWEQSGLSDDWACGHYAAASLSRTVIKQHFGVKE